MRVSSSAGEPIAVRDQEQSRQEIEGLERLAEKRARELELDAEAYERFAGYKLMSLLEDPEFQRLQRVLAAALPRVSYLDEDEIAELVA